MVGEDGGGSVELFGQDYAGELVREGEAAEGEENVGALAGVGGPAVGGAYGEDEALGSFVAEATDADGELFGGELVAAAVEEDGVGAEAAGLLVKPGEEGGFGVEDLGVAGDGAGGAGDVVGEEAVGGLGFCAGGLWEDCCQGDFHTGKLSLNEYSDIGAALIDYTQLTVYQ